VGALAVVAVVAGLGAGVLWLSRPAREIPLGAGVGDLSAVPASGCNGSETLCSRRVNEVLFPGTHNSMSAIEDRGWVHQPAP
jgi:hypothetical protein